MSTVDFDWVDTDTSLASCVNYLAGASTLAVDTEFMRTDTFYPIPALLQLSDGQKIFLIDPLPISQWQPLRDLLLDPSIIKVLHSVSEDMEVFQRLLDCVPQPLLDTQVGAGLAGLGSGLGYQKLIDQLLGISVEKGETRSNWLLRPLSDNQCVYAALDVEHLLPAFQRIQSRLEGSDRMAWWLEEGERQVRSSMQSTEPEQYFRRIKSGWKLSPVQQGRLKAVCAWREAMARELDIPRGRVIKDAVCVEIARRAPTHPAALAGIADMRESTVRKHGERICEILASAEPISATEALTRPLEGGQKAVAKQLRDDLDRISEAMHIPREMLLNKRDLEELVRSGGLPPDLQGWRTEALAPLTDRLAMEAP